MKKITAIFLSVVFAMYGAQPAVNDIVIEQATKTNPPTFANRTVTPAQGSILGFGTDYKPIDITLGSGLSLSGNNVLTVTANGTGNVTAPGSLTLNALTLGAGTKAVTVLGSLGTSTTILHGNASGAPTFGSVVNGDIAASTIDLPTKINGSALPVANLPAFSGGDATAAAGTGNIILSTVNSNVGTFGDATHVGQFTVDGKGRITSAGNVSISATGTGNVVMAANATAADNVVVTAGGNRTVIESVVTMNHTSGDIVTPGNLTVNGTTTSNNVTVPSGGTFDFSAATVTGSWSVANGGTGRATLTANAALMGNGTGGITSVSPGTSGNVLTSNGTAWTSAAASAGSGNVTNNATLTSGNIVLGGGTTVIGPSAISVSGTATTFPGNLTVNNTVMAPAATSLILHSNTTNTNSSSLTLNSNGNSEFNATDHYFYDTNHASVWGRIGATGIGVSSDAGTSNILYFANNGTLTGARQFQVNVHDATKRLDMTGNLTVPSSATVSGTNTGDQSTSIAATAWVEASGNNTTGAVGDILHPFLTIDAALDALPSTNYVVHIGIGTFASPTSSKIHSHGSFIGSGRPVTDSTYSVSGFLSVAVTDPTMLVGGTILQGQVGVPPTNTHISFENLGVDCGSAFIGGGSAQDCLTIAQDGTHPDQTTTPPRPGFRVFNVATLCKAFDSSVHGCLLENCYEPTVKSLYTYNGFAGLVMKTINGHAEDIHANGHSLYGVILKANDYAYMALGTLDGFEVCPIGGHSCGGVFIDSSGASSGNPAYGCVISNGTCYATSYGVKISGGLTDSCQISNVVAAGTSGIAFDITGIFTKLTNCTARSSASTGFYVSGASFPGINFSGCTATGCGGDGFQFDGSIRVDFDNITATLNTGHGINASGSAVYGGRYFVDSNTAGGVTGTINAASDNGGGSAVASVNTPELLWWPLNDAAGTVITKTVGVNGTTNAAWASGHNGAGSSLVGNGSTTKAYSTSSVTLGTGTVTVAGWFYLNDATTTQALLESGPVADTTANTFLWAISSGSIYFLVHGSGSETNNFQVTAPATGAWVHIAAVYNVTTNPGTTSVYYNGVLQSGASTGSTTTPTTFSNQVINLLVRDGGGTPLYPVNGNAQDLRIYSRLLSAAEIGSVMALGGPIAVSNSPYSSTWSGSATTVPTQGAVYGAFGAQVNYPLTVYASGTVASLTSSDALVDFGTTDPTLVLDKPGTYMLMGRAMLKYNGATYAGSQTATVHLRRTNNTAADVSNATTTAQLRIITTVTDTVGVMPFPPVIYTTTNSNDSISIYGALSATPAAGSVDCTEASIVAIKLY